MTLQEILFGTFTPPPLPGRVHRIGFAGERSYTPPKPRAKPMKYEGPSPSEQKAHDILKRTKLPMTSAELSRRLKITRNQCGIVMASLFKKGLLTRTKYAVGSTRFYKYQIKEGV